MAQIEKGVPLPSPARKSGGAMAAVKLLAAEGALGDSIYIQSRTDSIRAMAWRLSRTAWCTCRKEGEGTRIWKTAEIT